jgi:hypothetical protein
MCTWSKRSRSEELGLVNVEIVQLIVLVADGPLFHVSQNRCHVGAVGIEQLPVDEELPTPLAQSLRINSWTTACRCLDVALEDLSRRVGHAN